MNALYALLSDRQLTREYAAVCHDPACLGLAQGYAAEMQRRGLDLWAVTR